MACSKRSTVSPLGASPMRLGSHLHFRTHPYAAQWCKCRIFQGAVGGFILRVVIPVTAVAAVLAGLRALNNKGSGRVRTKSYQRDL